MLYVALIIPDLCFFLDFLIFSASFLLYCTDTPRISVVIAKNDLRCAAMLTTMFDARLNLDLTHGKMLDLAALSLYLSTPDPACIA
jgi:hypothetical protein